MKNLKNKLRKKMVFMLTVIIQMKILHKDAYNNALKQAEDIINNSSNPNLNAQDITNALNNINKHKITFMELKNYSKTKNTTNRHW